MWLSDIAWRCIAHIATRPSVADCIVRRAQRTPYTHITGADGTLYMGRWWLLNPYPGSSSDADTRPIWRKLMPSVRVHRIMRPDNDRDLHDHPWNARTIILRGWYREERPLAAVSIDDLFAHCREDVVVGGQLRAVLDRLAGYTGRLMFGEYHRIREVSPDGVWTVFITWRKRGSWGFDVDGQKVPWRTYLGLDEAQKPE
jgi:hypothetical protein